jgi:homocitrate synthase NifV
VPEWKAVVGERVFAVESGLHADGVLKHPGNYEGFDPAEVGLERQIVVGKHSGTHGVRHRLAGLDIVLPFGEEQRFMNQVRNRSQELKRPLSDNDLLSLLTERSCAA